MTDKEIVALYKLLYKEGKLAKGIAIVGNIFQARVYAQSKAWRTKTFPITDEGYEEAVDWQISTTVERDKLGFGGGQKGKLKTVPQLNNTSGKSGVYIYNAPRQYGYCKYIIAFWTIDGKTRKKYFPVNRFEDDVAISLANEFREEVEKIVNRLPNFDPKRIEEETELFIREWDLKIFSYK